MRSFVSGSLSAIEALMQETPNSNHRDDGCPGRYQECRSCRFHLLHSRRSDCVFDEGPYEVEAIGASVKGGGEHGSFSG